MASGGAEKFKAASALCEKGEAAAIANLLSKMPAMGNWIDAAGRSLLMLAIESKQPSCALALIPSSDVNRAGPAGLTPLMMAAIHGLESVVKDLLPESDALATDDKGRTALMHAAKHASARSRRGFCWERAIRWRSTIGDRARSFTPLRAATSNACAFCCRCRTPRHTEGTG